MSALPDFERAAALLRQADALVIAAGAGIGIDSGLPDFRGNEGFWRAYPALGRARLDFSEVASPHTFGRDPALAWGFYGHRLGLYRRTEPHAGFALLRDWAARLPHGAFVFTSNVDGQFQRAGFPGDRVHECHGSIHWLQCLRPCGDAVWPADALRPDVDAEACQWRGPQPSCPDCGGLARPNILMFGDGGWLGARYDAQAERLAHWLAPVRRPLVVEIGAGTQVPSVRRFGRAVLRAADGARLLRINPREPQVERPQDLGLALGALQALRGIEAALQRQGGAG
ncbi:SIR2 family NAD-dependent protein deacylase [Caldimonas tepidiphila]|uniref:SIR2 family NAD-dependent protein deacylase n=1 Tax=Caldimonas tepidiphila TaxID=2315841 RepID=UPI003AF35757